MDTILVALIIIIFFSLAFYFIPRVFYFPSLEEHVERNKHNIPPKGKLTLIDNKKRLYLDENNVIWYQRNFWQSLLHNPFQNYLLEEYDEKKQSSSEVEITRDNFQKGLYSYKTASFNYYSSIFSPFHHIVADLLPIIFYLAPNYKVFD